jgi:hypothetical protein
MIAKSLVVFSCFCSFASCQSPNENSEKNKSEQDKTVEAVVRPAIVQCYENQGGTDTVQLRLTDSAGIVSGDLNYRIQGKDANHGSFTGKMFGDTLIADYNFRSEGVQSVRQIAFLKKDSFLVEGFGPVNQVGKQMKFQSMDSLSFNEVNRLRLTACQ